MTHRPVLRAAARTLRVDTVTSSVVAALEQANVRPILLKGPSFAAWLYGDGAIRTYGDTDLLVSVRDLPAVRECLTALGFRSVSAEVKHPGVVDDHTWVRQPDFVDVHTTLIGIGVSPERAWEVLSGHTERLVVARREVEILDTAGRALHVVLHAAQHGPAGAPMLHDLERAVARLPGGVWRAAADLADELDALPAFATGLRLISSGCAVADALDLQPSQKTVELALRAEGRQVGALAFEEVRRIPGARRKLAYIGRKVIPTRAYIRHKYPVARVGRLGLARGYAQRWSALLSMAIPAGRSWIAARRASTPDA
jgi:hypothetical protein